MNLGHRRQPTWLYFLIVFALLFGGLELLARSKWAAQTLAPAGIGSNPFFRVQTAKLRQFAQAHDGVDCFFVGNSMVYNGIDPTRFEEGYQAQTGQSINCFSLGVPGMDVSIAKVLITYLAETYHPNLIVYGLSAQNFNEQHNQFEFEEVNTNWRLYVQGEDNFDGWLQENSYAYRLALTYQYWAAPAGLERVDRLHSFNGDIRPNGQDPAEGPLFDVDLPIQPSDENKKEKFDNFDFPSERTLNAFNQIVDLPLGPTQLVVVEMPVHSSFNDIILGGDDRHTAWIEQLEAAAAQAEVPFWPLSRIAAIPDEYWGDRNHLLATGSMPFSYWLGEQIGQAVDQQEWTPPNAMQLPDIEPFLSGPLGFERQADYERYLASIAKNEFIPSEAAIFNPNSGDNIRLKTYDLTSYLNIIAPTNNNFLTKSYVILDLFERMQFAEDFLADEQALLAEWAETWDPNLLIEVEIDYVMFHRTWLLSLPEEIQALVNDPTQYETIILLDHPGLPSAYTLYRPILSEPRP